jgi:hypothetical protein
MSLRLSPDVAPDALALCPDCVRGVHAYLSDEVKPEQSAYKKPYRPEVDPDEDEAKQHAIIAEVVSQVLSRKELNR